MCPTKSIIVSQALALFLVLRLPVFAANLEQNSRRPFTTHTNNGHQNDYEYDHPKLLTFIKNQPTDLQGFWKHTFQKKNIKGISLMILGTSLLVAADQSMFDETYRWGSKMGISHSGSLRTIAKTNIPGINYIVRLNGPYDLGTGLYFLGDGITHFSIMGSFLAYGWIKNNNRSLQTSSQLFEAIFAAGIVVQILKHATGRENPNTLTVPSGKWRLFPNQKGYAKHVNKYDAFPSGHLATAMVTVTVISENYPEYKFIRPLGYTLMTALAFQMVNNGVHWYSDYPLAIYMGYTFGHMAVQRGRKPKNYMASNSLEISPVVMPDGLGIRASLRFATSKTSNLMRRRQI